jgi:hypothetical protein
MKKSTQLDKLRKELLLLETAFDQRAKDIAYLTSLNDADALAIRAKSDRINQLEVKP